MVMRQMKCNMRLDLGLYPCFPLPCSSSSSSSSSSSDATSFATSPKSHHRLHRHHIAILHDGRACAFDLTELQARAILMLARREEESRDVRPPVPPSSRPDGNGEGRAYYLWSPWGVSMKRSLQRFLQGRRSRRARAQEISPYSHRITTTTSTSHRHHRRTDCDNQN